MAEDEYFRWKDPEKIQIKADGGKVTVLIKGQPYMSWQRGDEVAERIAIVQLYDLGLGTKEELSQVFNKHINSITNYTSAYKIKGASGLISRERGPKEKWKITPEVRAKILYLILKAGIKEYRVIQEKLERWNTKVSIESIRQVLMENGLVKESGPSEGISENLLENINYGQPEFEFSNFRKDNPEELSLVKEPGTNYGKEIHLEKKIRSEYSQAQRIYLDRLEQGEYNSYAGGLLFVPLLERYRYLPTIKKSINIETYEGYSLEELCLTLFYYDLFRFESMENFKTAYPEEYGTLLGRITSPGIYTLRRFLHKVKGLLKSEELIDEFAKEYLRSGITKWGVLYIDGKFLPYSGMYCISMGWHGVRKISMKGSYDFIAVDEKFTPLLFLLRSSAEDLLEKIPEIVLKAKKIAGEVGISEEDIKNLIVLFDREGFSAELFRILDGREKNNGKHKVRFITWAKYTDKWIDGIDAEKLNRTVIVNYGIQESEEISYYETERSMKKYGKIRAIVIENKNRKNKKRSAIYTNNKELTAETIIPLMCRRWGEENLIKELDLKHLIGYSPGYEVEEMEEQPMIDNPKIEELKQKRAELKSELSQIKSKFGDEVIEEMNKGKKWEEIKEKQLKAIADIESIKAKITLLNLEFEKFPEKLKFDEVRGKKLYEFNYEKKRFLDCIKVFTYNLEKRMSRLLLNHYDVKKEIYPALAMIIKRGGFIKQEGNKLMVQLRRFSNPEIDYAARHLCADLNKMNPTTLDRFRLPIEFEVI